MTSTSVLLTAHRSIPYLKRSADILPPGIFLYHPRCYDFPEGTLFGYTLTLSAVSPNSLCQGGRILISFLKAKVSRRKLPVLLMQPIAIPALLLLAGLHGAWCASPDEAVFVPGSLPLDTKGRQVHAHGGGIFQENGIFFWYGTTVKLPGGWISEGINLYSSPDLQSWAFEGEIFHDRQIVGVPFDHPYRIERPKILFSKRHQEYTMLFHLDTPSFALQRVGIAKAGKIRGPWRWVGSFQPDGQSSFDMTAWQDTDGTGYLVRSVGNSYLGVSRLNENFTDTEGICTSTYQAEAPAVFKPTDSEYVILASHLTGWSANPPQQFLAQGAKTLCDDSLQPVDPPVIGPGAETTFDSQPAYVFPLELESGNTLFIYMGDRWNFYGPGSVGAASYVWLPLLPNPRGPGFELRYFSKWSPKDVADLLDRDRMVVSS